MTVEPVDPGWRPAVRLALRLLRPTGTVSVLMVMRSSTVLLGGVAGLAGLIALLLGAGASSPRMDPVSAQVLLAGAVIAAASVMAVHGRVLPEVEPRRLAWFLFTTTQRKVMAAAAVGPAGMLLSWLSADGTMVIFGVGVAILLMMVAAPTALRIRAWQDEVDAFTKPYSVLGALLLDHR
jgi:hypothetical protein